MKKFKILLHLLVFTALPFNGQAIAAFRNPFFENVRITRGNADAAGRIIIGRIDSALNEPNLHIKHIWADGAYANHYQTAKQGLGYKADAFFAGAGVDYRCSSLLSFLDRCVIGLFAFYANTSMSYEGSESLKGDKGKHDSFILGFYSGYAIGRWTIFSSSLFTFTKHGDSLSVHSGGDLSGPLGKVELHSFCGNSSHSNLGISYEAPCKKMTIEPMVFLNYETIIQKKHSSGTVQITKQDAKYLQMILGVKLGAPLQVGLRQLKPYLFAGMAQDVYRHGNVSAAHTLFEGKRNFAVVEAGLSALVSNFLSVNMAYRGNYSKHTQVSAFTTEVSYKF
ncbi:MAG: autotransporter outer membrane beta-barrel domain-containing protein [Puniceicoccales bacterium]|jgi:outer membrane autotransporter protein|nr:autotransporter outer membrane beta-barrel domain-containing protein [Puniceicoccales bacterium]